jgi:hypothetical protein
MDIFEILTTLARITTLEVLAVIGWPTASTSAKFTLAESDRYCGGDLA